MVEQPYVPPLESIAHKYVPIEQKYARDIVVASISLAQLFSGDVINASDGSTVEGTLYLPEYQRPYRWGGKELFRLLEDLNNYFSSSSRAGHAFYLGSIILHQSDGKLNIIDGQQRITSMAILLASLNSKGNSHAIPELTFKAPMSQRQIYKNLQSLKTQTISSDIDPTQINITLVVTRYEDDAYHFFETQNTGGVRLSGPDIIKAHHLRATDQKLQNHHARSWESMGDLNSLVAGIMKSRYWKAFNFRELASWRNKKRLREQIVSELAKETLVDSADHAYQSVRFEYLAGGGWAQQLPSNGYAMRQPLNSGVNSIHFLQYFHSLRQTLLINQDDPTQENFYSVYNAIQKAKGSSYLDMFFDVSLLLYVSQFGTNGLHEASLWLFRVIFSPRLHNKKMVRESTVQAFCKETPLLDWITSSYNHQQLMGYLKNFQYTIDKENLGTSGVKQNFVIKINEGFELGLNLPKEADKLSKGSEPLHDSPEVIIGNYDTRLRNALDVLIKRAEERK